ncbi:MAG: alanine racemase, partial [Spirochaetaceae bacterium]|nr:alanine racemase [Spirochaetaceae bacterium]
MDRLCRNIAAVRSWIGSDPMLCMPVKADGYGHGAVPIAQEALRQGVAVLGVASVEEGRELRNAGITAPILLFSTPLPEELEELAAYRLSPLVGDGEYAKSLAEVAAKVGVRLAVHLKVDTGMGRLGCEHGEAATLDRYIAGCPS